MGPRALSNGLNSAIFFCFFEAIRQVRCTDGLCRRCARTAASPSCLLLNRFCFAHWPSLAIGQPGGRAGRPPALLSVQGAPPRRRRSPAATTPPHPAPRQVLIKKQAEQLQPARQQQQRQLKQQRSLRAKLRLPQPAVAASRPQGSPAACLSLALPMPGWQGQ